MCLYTKQIKPVKATKDIKVYKILELSRGAKEITTIGGRRFEISELILKSPRGFVYEVGKTHTSKLDRQVYYTGTYNSRIEAALHSYTNLRVARFNKGANNVIVQCVVPKGSLHYVGSNNGSSAGIASDKLKVVKIL